ncbi:MAG: alpha-2-macroglobulin family protein, partial [Planctomycetota bacterium]
QPELVPDIRKFFIHRRWNQVATGSSLQYWERGRGQLKEKSAQRSAAPGAPPAEEAEGMMADRAEFGGERKKNGKGGGAYAKTEVRSLFADTMFWTPSVVTDENGKATIEIPQIADNLTTWRITARVASIDGKFGQAAGKTIVRKEVIVRLHTPRYFTQGDKTVVSAVVHNYLESEKDVRIQFKAEGIETGGEEEFDVTVPSKGEKRLDWPATMKEAGKAVITVKALTDEDSDAMKLEVPVLPHGSLQWKSLADVLKDRKTEKITVPEDAVAAGTELLVVVSPTHASMVLDALEYLADYPYGCVEQTMSRFLPCTITRQVLQKLDISKPDLEEELPDMISAGLQRLYGFQQPDGGWGWWKHDESNPFTTAYVVYGLAMAQVADVAVEPNVLNRGIAALQRHLEKADDVETKAYILFALSLCGRKAENVRNVLTDDLSELPSYAKAMLAIVLAKDGQKEEAKRVLKALAGEAEAGGAMAYWKGTGSYKWTGHGVEVTALALKAFMAIDPDHDLVPRIVTWLCTHRQGHYWISTRQTAMVVFAMADYIAHTGEMKPDMTLTLSLNGDRIYERQVTEENWKDFEGTVKFTADRLNTGENEITLEKTGNGSPVYSIFLKYFKKADTFEPSKGGLQVEREYFRVVYDGKERLLEAIGEGDAVKSGDEVQVKLHIKADRIYRYLVVEDPMPAGFEAVREYYQGWRWHWWYSHKEFRDEKVAVAVTYLPRGEREVTYVMRAEMPGEFRVLPTLVWNMYRPEEGGNSAGFSIRVEEK